jgi:hypothetical protein
MQRGAPQRPQRLAKNKEAFNNSCTIVFPQLLFHPKSACNVVREPPLADQVFGPGEGA